MKRLFIFGAGFSNAIAGLPLGRELANIIYKMSINISPKNRGLRKLADGYCRVWKYLQDQAMPLIDFLEKDGTEIAKLDGRNYPIDLEYLLTLIDLNLNNPYIPKGKGVDLQQCPIPYIKGISTFTLEDARRFIMHSIADIMSPKNYKSFDNVKMLKIMELIRPGDSIVTFNYDLLIEQGLFQRGLWNPVDGYGLGGLSRHEKITKNDLCETRVDLIKLHGSINWIPGSQFIVEPDVIINLIDTIDGKCYFDGIHVKYNHPQYESRYPRDPLIVMPTFLKHFNKPYELNLINEVVDRARSTEEIYLIGYSLPSADTTANFIFSQIPRDANLVIVNKKAKELRSRLIDNYSFKSEKIIYEESDINTWIENDFEFRQYKIDKENEEFSNSIIEMAKHI